MWTFVCATLSLQLVEVHAINILKSQLKKYRKILFPHNASKSSESDNQDEGQLTTEDKQDSEANEGVLKIILHVLKEVGQQVLASKLEKRKYKSLMLGILRHTDHPKRTSSPPDSVSAVNKLFTSNWCSE